MLDYLLHLWATPPEGLELSCPAAAEGTTANPYGSFDDVSVRSAYQLVSIESISLVLIGVLLCYLLGNLSTGPRFSRRWLLAWAATIVATGIVTWIQLSVAPTTALAGSCESNPTAFPVALPGAEVLKRILAGLLWTLLAFPAVSVLLTRVVGFYAASWNGFFHARGTPWPRFSPWGK